MFRQTSSRGFTLIEILVCVIILGIASAIIVPQIGTRDDLKTAAAARIVMADVIYAQNRAVSTQVKHYIVFDTVLNKYTITQSSPTASAITNPVTNQPYVTQFGSAGTSGTSDAAINSASFDGGTVLAFDELGSPYSYDSGTGLTTALSAAGSVVVKVGQFTMTISIQPDTGEITVQ